MVVTDVAVWKVFLTNIPISMQFVLVLVMITAAVFILWDHFFLRETNVIRDFLQEDWRYFGLAVLATEAVNHFAIDYRRDTLFTDMIYQFEGDVVRAFQQFQFEPLTWTLSIVYFALFPVIILATYFKVKETDRAEAERYAIAYALTTLAALPFFILFPVRVTGHTILGVEPLLYDLHPLISDGFTQFDSLVKAFPSLHAGLSLLATFYAWKTTRTYAILITISTVLIIFSIFYLGVHWITDAIAGALLVSLIYLLSEHIPLEKELTLRCVHK